MGAAQAQEPTALSWVRLPGAEGCIAAPELARAVAARRGGRDVFTAPGNARRAVEARVAPTEDGFRAVVIMNAADGTPVGERTVESQGSDCRTLDGPLVLVLAAAVQAADEPGEPGDPAMPTDGGARDPSPDDLQASLARVGERAAAVPDEPAAVGEVVGSPTPHPPAERDASPPVAEHAGVRIGLRASGGVHVGILPRAAGAGGLGLSVVVPGALMFGLDGQVAPEQVPGQRGIAVRLLPWWVEAWVCPSVRREGLSPVVCVAASVGRMRGVAVRTSDEVSPEAWFEADGSYLVHVGPRLGLRYGLAAFAAWARLGLSLALNREAYVFRRVNGEETELHRVEPVAFGATVGVEVSF